MNLTATEEARLDQFLSKALDKSRNSISDLIRSDAITVNGKTISKPSFKLNIDDQIEIDFPKPKELDLTINVDFDVEIIYEDDHLLVINKPSDLVVHPASSYKGATLVDWLKSRGYALSTISGERRNGIVHRLDKETTGLLIVAKTDIAHQKIAAQLEDRSLGRYYLAVIDLPLKESLTIDKPIARHPTKRTKMAIVPNGKEAKTSFVKLLDLDGTELIAAKLYSGRTHQIRVHLSSINRHILGDELYGYKRTKATLSGFFLHAYRLDLIHPATNKQISFTASLPKHFANLLEKHTKERVDEIVSTIGDCFDNATRVCSNLT